MKKLVEQKMFFHIPKSEKSNINQDNRFANRKSFSYKKLSSMSSEEIDELMSSVDTEPESEAEDVRDLEDPFSDDDEDTDPNYLLEDEKQTSEDTGDDTAEESFLAISESGEEQIGQCVSLLRKTTSTEFLCEAINISMNVSNISSSPNYKYYKYSTVNINCK